MQLFFPSRGRWLMWVIIDFCVSVKAACLALCFQLSAKTWCLSWTVRSEKHHGFGCYVTRGIGALGDVTKGWFATLLYLLLYPCGEYFVRLTKQDIFVHNSLLQWVFKNQLHHFFFIPPHKKKQKQDSTLCLDLLVKFKAFRALAGLLRKQDFRYLWVLLPVCMSGIGAENQ